MEDVPRLVDRFLSKTGSRYTITNEAMDMMLKHDWPGNVRELHNAIERLVALAPGPLLMGSDLPSTVLNGSGADLMRLAAAVSVGPVRNQQPSEPRQILPLHEVEKRAIIEALEQTKGDRAVTAMLLGIGRTTLYRKPVHEIAFIIR